jgi:predicted RecA/RadA family phage recombinase
MATANRRAPGGMIDYTPGGAVSAGAVVVSGAIIGIALADIEADRLGALATQGIFEVTKAAHDGGFTLGQTVYWDAANSRATPTQGAATVRMGVAAAVALTAATTVMVLLDQPQVGSGAAGGNRSVSGTASVTGTLEITSGLSTVTQVIATFREDITLGGALLSVTVPTQSGADAGKFTLKVFEFTSNANPTPIACDAAKSISWVAYGT